MVRRKWVGKTHLMNCVCSRQASGMMYHFTENNMLFRQIVDIGVGEIEIRRVSWANVG